MKKYTVNELRRAFIAQGHPHFALKNMKIRGETVRLSYLVRYNENEDLFLIRYAGKLGFAVWYISQDGNGKLHMNKLPEWHLTYRKYKRIYRKKIEEARIRDQAREYGTTC